ncbi:MAG TPA: MurT ligase domain-containing protein [Candidatus Gastranaerophilales bacterium]|nr:MurT ligase domain-containing protein [Candidatus Gastranaerophilales bacterium]
MIKNLLHKITICVVKSLSWAIKALKTGSGTNLPGKIARKLSPDILSFLVKQTKKEIITITGTNGKTTTAGLLASVFREDGRKIVHNSRGANMLTGITATAIENSSIKADMTSDNCIFEIDEAYLNLAFNEFNPHIIAVTNLFRDQLDRYGELNATAKKIESAIAKTSVIEPLKLILNADDPLVSMIGNNFSDADLNKIFYGFEEIIHQNSEEKIYSPQESINCKCGKPFSYLKIFYGHLGYYECSCGVKRPATKVFAKAYIGVNSSNILVKTLDNQEFTVNINLPGLYNCYNALSAVTAALEAEISIKNIQKGIENYATTFGRSETLKIKGKDVIIQLIKNPIGATEVLKTVKNDDKGKLFIVINDNYADGRDVSWLWDANFELLANYNKPAVISGTRAADMALRLKYAGLDSKNLIVSENIKSAFLEALGNVNADEKLYVLPTYTALLELEKIKKNNWQ